MNVFDRILNKEVHFSKIENPVILGRYYFTSNYSDYLNNDINHLQNRVGYIHIQI